MSWRVDFAFLLQSCLNISLEQLSECLSPHPNDLEQALAFLPQEQQEYFVQKAKSFEYQTSRSSVERTSLQLCFYGEPDYPQTLLGWRQAPQVLWYLGQPVWNQREGIAVVGSRSPSSSTEQWLNWQLSDFLRRRPAMVVSGGANGIDQIAHWLAVRQKVPTVALMPLGLKGRYPPSFHHLEPALLAGGGAILSPFLPDWPLHKANFARRNQVISALSRITFIAEARRRSGTLLTARAALSQEKPLAVLPCSPMSAQGLGGLDLLVEGSAQLIRDCQDLLIFWDRHERRQMQLETPVT